MPVLTYTMPLCGPVIDVTLRPAQPLAPGIGLRVRTVKLLVDTGADCTKIDEQIVTQWRLTPSSFSYGGFKTLNGSTSGPQPLFNLNFEFFDAASATWPAGTLDVATANHAAFTKEPFKGVLGRDILDRCVLRYDGPRRMFTLDC